MAQPLSTPQPLEPALSPAPRLARVVAAGGIGLGALLLVVALALWLRYGTTVFFEMIASGFTACF
jgi:hypothetical protein